MATAKDIVVRQHSVIMYQLDLIIQQYFFVDFIANCKAML